MPFPSLRVDVVKPVCHVVAVLRRDDDGTERNAVKTYEVLGKDEPAADPFAPKTEV